MIHIQKWAISEKSTIFVLSLSNMVIFTKFDKEIVDFLLMANFWMCTIFQSRDFTYLCKAEQKETVQTLYFSGVFA